MRFFRKIFTLAGLKCIFLRYKVKKLRKSVDALGVDCSSLSQDYLNLYDDEWNRIDDCDIFLDSLVEEFSGAERETLLHIEHVKKKEYVKDKMRGMFCPDLVELHSIMERVIDFYDKDEYYELY